MRTLIRYKIDVSCNPDLTQLSYLEAISVSFRYKFSRFKPVIKRENKLRNKALQERMERIETLKKIALYKIGKKLNDEDSIYNKISFFVSRGEKDILDSTFKSSDFIAYEIKIIPENKDFLLSFPSLPIKIEVRRKGYEE